MFNIIKKEIIPNLFHLNFETQYEVTSTFLRMQEFYESPYKNIRGKYFTLEEYMDTYAADKGSFTYFEDWIGFNVPGNVVIDFYKTFSNDLLLQKEQDMKRILISLQKEGKLLDDKFYLIGTYGTDDVSTMNHELAHGFYYLNTEYQEHVLSILQQVPEDKMSAMIDWLKKAGYAEPMFLDEINAYLSTSHMGELGDRFSKENIPWKQVQQCKQLFEQYYKQE